MRKKIVVVGVLFLIAVLFLGDTGETATILPIPETVQPANTVLCWAAVSESVLNYYGMPTSLCNIVEEFRVAKNLQFPAGSNFHHCCDQGAITPDIEACNTGASSLDIYNILQKRSITLGYLPRAAEANEVLYFLDKGWPMLVNWQWEQPGPNGQMLPNGHTAIIRGIEYNNSEPNKSNVWYMDPRPDILNHYRINTLEWVKSPTGGMSPTGGVFKVDWEDTPLPTKDKTNSVPTTTTYINGTSGNVPVRLGTPINISGYLNPKSYTDTSDWWVVVVIGERFCYVNSNGELDCDHQRARYSYRKLQEGLYDTLFTVTLPAGSGLSGTYPVCFGIDLNPDGQLPNEAFAYAYYSCSNAIIQP